MRRRTFITAVSASAASVALAGCTNVGNGGANETGSPADSGEKRRAREDDALDVEAKAVADRDQDALRIRDTRLIETRDERAGVIGEVRNAGTEAYTSVEVEATLYDESDDVLGEFLDNTEEVSLDDLGPGEVWDFEIWFEDADLGKAASYSLSATGETEGTADVDDNNPDDPGSETPTED